MSTHETISQKIATVTAKEHLNVLIVEDDPDMLAVLAEIMLEAGDDIKAARLCVSVLHELIQEVETTYFDWNGIDVVFTASKLGKDPRFGQNLVSYLAIRHPQILLIGTATTVNEPEDVDAYLDKGSAYILPKLRTNLRENTRGRWNTPLPR